MAYFNHAFHKLFVGTHITQGGSGTAKAVDTGFLNSQNVPSVQMINPAAPYSLGVGVYGLFFQDPTLGLVSVNAASGTITTGKPMLLVSSALYQHDKNGPFHGGYQETTKSKLINPRYISRFLRVDPCTPNQNVIHVGNTPFTISGVNLTPTLATNSNCCMQFLCGETYFLRVDVKGSPALRTLSRNAYWTMDYETGCCPTGCIAPTPIDSTLAMIGWANQIINSPIVGPYMLPVVYDQLGGAWYSPGTSGEFFQNVPHPGIGTLAFVNQGSGYVNGTFNNVQFGTLDETPSNGSGATATVTVAGGIVTVITIDTFGTGYKIGDLLKLPMLEGTEDNAVFSVATNMAPTWDNYVSPGYIAGKCAGMSLTGAYIDTRFGDCTFYPSDWFEKQPVNIYASMVDEEGEPCEFAGICVETQCMPRQAMGLGEQVLRDLILSESYMQNIFNTSKDLRIREITQGYDITNAIERGNLYTRYQILHHVPRFNNPSGVFDNDQYMLEIITLGVSAAFEATMAAWTGSCGGCPTGLEVIACQIAACPVACPVVTLTGPVAGTFHTGAPYAGANAVGGVGASPFVYEVTGGTLPVGISMTSAGIITGTPTALAGTAYSFSISATDVNGCSVTVTFADTVRA